MISEQLLNKKIEELKEACKKNGIEFFFQLANGFTDILTGSMELLSSLRHR